MYAAQTPSSLWDNIYLGPAWRFDYGDQSICPLPQTSLGAFTWEVATLFKPCTSLTFCNSRTNLSLWRPRGFFFSIRWAHLKRHGEVFYSLPSRERLCHNEQAALGCSQLFLGSIIWWVLSTAPNSLQLLSKKMSWSVQIGINPFSPLRDCVLWLPG